MLQLVDRVCWGQSTYILLTSLHGFKDQGVTASTQRVVQTSLLSNKITPRRFNVHTSIEVNIGFTSQVHRGSGHGPMMFGD